MLNLVKSKSIICHSVRVALYSLTLVIASPAFAFKVDTHVWIGQQVIEDLQDGYLKFDINDRQVDIRIADDVRNTILNNQAYFRMGNIGPDASPDIVSGQTVVHPGSEEHWETDDWLTYIRDRAQDYSSRERAYVYGYQAHAAADMFAHTYVNMYSGGIFDLSDSDVGVEKRHILLEAYISKYTPKVTQLELALPTDFLRREMVMNSTVAHQYSRTGSSGYLEKIFGLRQEIQNVLDSDELRNIEEEMVKQGINTAFGIRVPDGLAAELNRTWQDIEKLQDDAIDEAQRLAEKQNQNLIKLRQYQNDVDLLVLRSTESALEKIVNFDADSVSAVVSLQNQINKTIVRIGDKIEERVCEKHAWALLGLGACETWKPISKWSSAQQALWNEVDNLNEKLAEEKLRAIRNTIRELKDIATDTSQITQEVIRANHQITQNVIDFGQRFNGEPIRGFLTGWRDDIDVSVNLYIAANADTMKQTMIADSNPTRPIREWLDCSAPSLLGIPAEISDTKCEVKNLVEDLNGYFNSLQDTALGLTPLGFEILKLKERIETKILAERDRIQTRLVESVLPPEVKELIEIFSTSPTDDALNQLFLVEGTDFHLLPIPQMAARVRAEMHLRSDNTFHPKDYVVIRNAITMVKLSLLDAQQLNELAYQSGVMLPGTYGNSLYYGSETVFTRSIRSIDGNHQWLEFAPPYPRNAAYPDHNIHQFGYAFSYDEGFRFWQDGSAREKLFKKLFVGPIAPGIEAPEILGFTRVLPASYPYESCSGNPFPFGAGDKTCVVIKILPAILSILMQ